MTPHDPNDDRGMEMLVLVFFILGVLVWALCAVAVVVF